MNLRKNIVRNGLDLLPYWYHSRRAKACLRAKVTKVHYGDHQRQYFLVAEATETAPDAPDAWAFYFHGGGWTFGTPESFLPAARPWLRAGFRVVLPSYRRPPHHNLADIHEDCGAAAGAVVTWAHTNGRPVTTPPRVGGISAGGQLAASLALQPSLWTDAHWPAGPTHVYLGASPLNLRCLRPRRLFKPYDHLNPTTLLENYRGKPLSWLLVHGRQDAIVAYRHSAEFYRQLRAKNHPARLITLEKGTHVAAGEWTHRWEGKLYEAVEKFARSTN